MTLFDLAEAPAATTAAGPRYRVAGLDISLTGTGVSTLGGTTCIRTKGRRADSIPDRRARQKHIVTTALTEIGTVDLACVEGPSHASMAQAGHHDLSGLWWCIVGALVDRDIPVAIVPPMSRAKYATGKGNSRKAAVLDAAQKRYGAMGLDWLGQPLAEVPDGHRAALAGVQWPDREAVAR